MSELYELLAKRAGNVDLPDELGPDPAPETDLSAADFARAAKALDVDQAVIRAVAEVETNGRAFLADGRPQILYEAHIFHRETQGRFGQARDRQGVRLSVVAWDRSLYGRGGEAQYDRLEDAAALDWTAAHRSCSWGLFQVMGFNHEMVGHPTIRGFVQAAFQGAGPHLDMFVAFVRARRLDEALRRRDWEAFARGYNGPGFAQNRYDQKLAAAFRRWSAT